MKRRQQTLLLIMWIILIYVLTGYPSIETPKIKEFPIDKLYHFLLFFIMGILGYPILKKARHYFLLGTGVAITAEFQQIFIPGREFELLDILAGFIGLFVVFFVFNYVKNRGKYVSET